MLRATAVHSHVVLSVSDLSLRIHTSGLCGTNTRMLALRAVYVLYYWKR